ncbi:sialate O-acetylesterase [Puia sp. P3]|uniref:sialate O-acetylesterase n=1 Tax=Puia sp. P3 TaxID=3423952 RepID=UPI003D66FC93
MRIFFLSCSLVITHLAFAGIRLGSGLQDGMVVQQNKPMTVWGWSDPGASVAILPDWAAGATTVVADASGYFSGIVAVPAVRAGDYGAHALTVSSGASQIRLSDILIGEVWLCSGQSNMQFALREALDSTAEVAAARHPHIRLLDVALNFSAAPIDSFRGKWTECTPKTAARFSAVGYFFGRRLQQALDLPVGLVFSGIGASAAQAYVPQDVLAGDTMLDRLYLEPYLNSSRSKEIVNGGFSFEKVTRPYLLYNAIIYPLRRMSIRGICWYQGEANRLERHPYTHLTQTMIASWRRLFGQGELPFYYVEVAPFFWDNKDSTLADYAFFREAQRRISELGNTAMVSTVDVGEAKNLHPHNKKPIGIRLAQTALNRTYGRLDTPCCGPRYQHLEIKGRKVTVFFEPGTADGLHTDGGSEPRDFVVAGADQRWYPARASIEGDRIVIWSDEVKKPVAIRYAFTNAAVTDLRNAAGWPVPLFRTDAWPEPPIKTK